MTIDFKPCPFCGHTDIGVKDNIVDTLIGSDESSACCRKIWAYCRHCEATSGYTVRDITYDDEEIMIAMELWNTRKR